ncbi:uncharacterized protein [Pyxicephalus adspersus]|uniref:uncharacterized protein n=1 Tax=Pyxicephalus adspersus TaxID=30357 RepID=UPI003B5BFBCF
MFSEFNFSTAVQCDGVENLYVALKEAPLETDWLCLTNYHAATIEPGVFSRLTNLNVLYIKTRSVDLLPGVFSNLPQLTTLWIKREYRNDSVTFHKDTFLGLNSLHELKISSIELSAFKVSLVNIPYGVEHLILEDNNITYLSDLTASLGTFRNLKNLAVIGNNISELRKADCLTLQNPANYGQFVNFNITHLDLTSNKLSIIEQNSLCNFPHLKCFTVGSSGVEPDNLYQSGIKRIKTLSLQNTGFNIVEICELASHFKVEELLLMFNFIDKMNTFKGSCKSLKKLNLSGNDLTKIEVKKMQRFTNLLELDLSKNDIENLKICTNESMPMLKLVNLNVSDNFLLSVQKRQFECLKELKILSLENNKINFIEDLAFDGLDELRLLNLKNNNLFRISDLTFSNLFLVKHLNLYENTISHFDQKAFINLFSLQDFMVTYDFSIDLDWWFFIRKSVRNMSVKTNILDLRNVFEDEFPLFEALQIDSPNIVANFNVFAEAKELHLKNMVYFENTDALWSPLASFKNLEKLYFTGHPLDVSNISDFFYSMENLPSLKFLFLHDTDKIIKYNQINIIKVFKGLSHLKVLHLKNSGIDHLDSKDIFSDLYALEFLIIEDQIVQEIEPIVFDSMPNLKYIYFLQTTFPCSCKFKGLLSWLESTMRVSIIGFYQQECLINHVRINFIFFLNNNCQSDLDFIMFIVSFLCTLLFMCISLFYESIWWYLLYMIYTVKCWLNRKLQDKDKYEYDVFVSYNTNNEMWVTEHLLPNLEQDGPPFFKVCIHNRDFEIGRDIVENIMDSIYKSRWTISVITRSYLQSNWCSLEMRMATYRLLTESKNSFILIFLDKISREELHYYYRLSKLLDKKTYLEWPDDEDKQKLFWARLRKVIAKSGRQLK